ncbi:uncharacterized, partial [Tachysurus ichikawai]
MLHMTDSIKGFLASRGPVGLQQAELSGRMLMRIYSVSSLNTLTPTLLFCRERRSQIHACCSASGKEPILHRSSPLFIRNLCLLFDHITHPGGTMTPKS